MPLPIIIAIAGLIIAILAYAGATVLATVNEGSLLGMLAVLVLYVIAYAALAALVVSILWLIVANTVTYFDWIVETGTISFG